MRSTAILLCRYVEGTQTQFVIPDSRGGYAWSADDCSRLFDDIIALSRSKREGHYMGAIVTTLADCYGHRRMVVDGSQRLVCISLLLLAAIRAVGNGLLTLKRPQRIDEVRNRLLVAEDAPGDCRAKLLLGLREGEVYSRILAGEVEGREELKSPLMRNFHHFYELLTYQSEGGLTCDALIDAILRLQIVAVELEPTDDASLIFDRINRPAPFLPTRSEVKLKPATASEVKQPSLAEHSSGQHPDKLTRKMKLVEVLEMKGVERFFDLFLEYACERKLSPDEVWSVMDWIENFLTRHLVCGASVEALERMLPSLHEEVTLALANESGNRLGYLPVLEYRLTHRNNNMELPDDKRFRNALLTRNIYKMTPALRMFLFERLENAVPGEYNDVVGEMKRGEATIEHIMPQSLSKEWKAMLGDGYKAIHSNYLHKFPNLTLSGFNSELGNKPFAVKRDGEKKADKVVHPGFRDSKYRMNRSISQCDVWTEAEFRRRGDTIADTFLRLYPYPKLSYGMAPTSVNTSTPTSTKGTSPTAASAKAPKASEVKSPSPSSAVNPSAVKGRVEELRLNNTKVSPVSRKLKGFRLFGKEYADNTWKRMVIHVVQLLAEQYPDAVERLYDREPSFKRGNLSSQPHWSFVSPKRYFKIGADNQHKLQLLRTVFRQCQVAESELVLLLEPIK